MDTCETIIPNICVPLWSKEDYTRYRSLLVTISSTIPSSLTVVIPSSKEWHQYFTVLSSFQRPHSLFPSRVVFSPTLNVEPETMYYIRNTTRSYSNRSMLRSSKMSHHETIYFLLSDENITRIREDEAAATEEEDRDQEIK